MSDREIKMSSVRFPHGDNMLCRLVKKNNQDKETNDGDNVMQHKSWLTRSLSYIEIMANIDCLRSKTFRTFNEIVPQRLRSLHLSIMLFYYVYEYVKKKKKLLHFTGYRLYARGILRYSRGLENVRP